MVRDNERERVRRIKFAQTFNSKREAGWLTVLVAGFGRESDNPSGREKESHNLLRVLVIELAFAFPPTCHSIQNQHPFVAEKWVSLRLVKVRPSCKSPF